MIDLRVSILVGFRVLLKIYQCHITRHNGRCPVRHQASGVIPRVALTGILIKISRCLLCIFRGSSGISASNRLRSRRSGLPWKIALTFKIKHYNNRNRNISCTRPNSKQTWRPERSPPGLPLKWRGSSIHREPLFISALISSLSHPNLRTNTAAEAALVLLILLQLRTNPSKKGLFPNKRRSRKRLSTRTDWMIWLRALRSWAMVSTLRTIIASPKDMLRQPA